MDPFFPDLNTVLLRNGALTLKFIPFQVPDPFTAHLNMVSTEIATAHRLVCGVSIIPFATHQIDWRWTLSRELLAPL